ncbi:hypothetical protein Ancab_032138 [Ancistrocladus abbreviatus]
MAGQEVKLFGAWASPFSNRIEIALKLKGVEYEYIEEDLQNKSPELLKYNPVYKKIPVLVHNGKPIAESLVILEYVDETWKDNPILPQDPYERAMARFWAKFIDEKVLPSTWKALWGAGEEQVKAVEEANENLKILEKELEGKRFFGGESIGYVDIVANFTALWIPVVQEAVERQVLAVDFPTLCKWKGEFLNNDFIKENMPPKDKLKAFYRARLEAAKEFK